MKKLIFILLALISLTEMSAQDLKPEYQKFIKTFISSVQRGDKAAVANMISYPLKRKSNPVNQKQNGIYKTIFRDF